MAGSPAFHLFRFPIHVRPGFLVFIALVIAVNGGELGVWIAGSAAVLTLLHELGHGFAARATGAEAEISLDFLAGYASFVPTRRLKRWERAGISVAGPAVQIGVSLVVLLLMGVNPLDRTSYAASEAALAIWWTGPIMGLLNLVPVLPLDGGHIVLAGLDRVVGDHSRKVMLWFSIGLTSVMGVYLVLTPGLESMAVFVLFPLMIQIQMLTASRSHRPARGPNAAAAAGEAAAWASGDVGSIPPSLVPSPWFRAAQQVRHGEPQVARDVLVADFADSSPASWWPPDAASLDDLRTLVALLPRPLPTGRIYSEHVLSNILVRLGMHDEAAVYAAGSFGRHRSTTTAAVVARAASALGDTPTALGWLRAAIEADTDPNGLAITMDHAPELAAVRHDPRFVELRQLIEA
ncbi:MAG: site-2 protease family protein [Ilumatobacteraceae bacterium]